MGRNKLTHPPLPYNFEPALPACSGPGCQPAAARPPCDMPPPRRLLTAILAGAAISSACEQAEQVQDRLRDLTPHEAYLASLSEAGLGQTALVRDWVAVSLRAVQNAPAVRLPFQEEGYIAPDEAVAMAYRLRIGRGQRLTGRVTLGSDPQARVFVDLFRVPDDPADPLRPVLSADTVPGEFSHEPWREGEYILRVQPELLRGGRYRVVLRTASRPLWRSLATVQVR